MRLIKKYNQFINESFFKKDEYLKDELRKLSHSDENMLRISEFVESFKDLNVTSLIPIEKNKFLIATFRNGLFIYENNQLVKWQTSAENFLKENQPSLDLTQTVQAPSGELVSFEITFGVEFFRPFF